MSSRRKVYTIAYLVCDVKGTPMGYQAVSILASPHWAGTEPELVSPHWYDKNQAILAARAHNAYVLVDGKPLEDKAGQVTPDEFVRHDKQGVRK